MSWNVYLTDIDPDDLEEEAQVGYDGFKAGYHDDAEVFPAMDEQFDAALEAARALVKHGVVGAGDVSVTLSGHANPGHRPRDGWANDQVTVSVVSAARATS